MHEFVCVCVCVCVCVLVGRGCIGGVSKPDRLCYYVCVPCVSVFVSLNVRGCV